ncbi:MFS transporter [Streptomyces sp. SL13]|uniref:MFS transporter n=1 Tax=Streptantibioticus silvisoli TaxID=2705255 RepID=A0AA90JW84_9ACTN|nr:MFS transporter [Streptantibioticus silvisoli]MDI5968741.1 MFS transporter [Streptantibioticus silvisoli]
MSGGTAVEPAPAGPLAPAGRPRPWWTVFGAVFVSCWCGNQFTPLLVMYKERQHYDATTVNLFLGVYVLGLAPALLVAGALSDRYGRRPLMFAGLLASTAASATLAFGATGPGPIYAGRLLSGAAVGIAMAVGNSWLKEVSQAPWDVTAEAGTGARRASLAFTLGSGIGALVAGVLAQWGPWGEELPFVVHLAVSVPFLWLLPRVPETSAGRLNGTPGVRFRLSAARHRRFAGVVAVAAPWLFAGAALAYGYLPVLLSPSTGRWGLPYATGLTVFTLGVAALVQPLAKRIDTASSARGLLVALAAVAAGLLLTAAAAATRSPALGVVTACVMGAGIGVGLVSGLLEVQRMAPPGDLARLTGVFYALAYLGFLTPAAMAALTPPFTTTALLLAVTALVAAAFLLVLRSHRRHLPGGP